MEVEIRKETTAESLKNLIISKKELFTFSRIAAKTKTGYDHFNRVLSGERNMTPNFKKKLFHYLETECDIVIEKPAIDNASPK